MKSLVMAILILMFTQVALGEKPVVLPEGIAALASYIEGEKQCEIQVESENLYYGFGWPAPAREDAFKIVTKNKKPMRFRPERQKAMEQIHLAPPFKIKDILLDYGTRRSELLYRYVDIVGLVVSCRNKEKGFYFPRENFEGLAGRDDAEALSQFFLDNGFTDVNKPSEREELLELPYPIFSCLGRAFCELQKLN